ncbi:hypothetical protein FOZ62_003629 [Perkinsus olseni]|uniref:Uncharacterized protein n=1 Tax=Perkinsus olseni TaxID=32597 RepID=A0A7J6SKP3_PEROL|nr:hypothetical protein FOZ62_003629 [Perkinsus olseni]
MPTWSRLGPGERRMASLLLDTSAGFESPVNQGEGGNYEKPVGQCRLSPTRTVVGCQCTTSDMLSAISQSSKFKVDWSVCASDCESTSDCPTPPKGTPTCLAVPQVCAMNCKENSDCLEGGSCIKLAEYHACMFKE